MPISRILHVLHCWKPCLGIYVFSIRDRERMCLGKMNFWNHSWETALLHIRFPKKMPLHSLNQPNNSTKPSVNLNWSQTDTPANMPQSRMTIYQTGYTICVQFPSAMNSYSLLTQFWPWGEESQNNLTYRVFESRSFKTNVSTTLMFNGHKINTCN